MRELIKHNNQFRVLALSATPGGDLKVIYSIPLQTFHWSCLYPDLTLFIVICLLCSQSVQEVLGNLLIAHIELRAEDSIDIRPYTHERKVEKIVVKLGDELNHIIGKYILV